MEDDTRTDKSYYDDCWSSTKSLSRNTNYVINLRDPNKFDISNLRSNLDATLRSYKNTLRELDSASDWVSSELIKNEMRKVQRLKTKLIKKHPQFFV